ncbi:tetratricopeptide repeat protein [Candidatus Poribacteria bacterium]|nr:tetratricopeptide repeat protein [Candidatus Poribacteria bacterium]
MEIKLPEIQAIIDELKNDSQTMANEQVRKAVEQLDEMRGELNLKQTLVTPDALLAPQACLKQIERLVSTIPQLFESVSQKEMLLGLLLQAATICRRMGETEHTLQYCEQILDFTGIQGYTHIRAEALRQLGHLQFYLQQWSQAQAYYKQCLALFEEEDDRGGIASIYNRLGNIASEQGEYELARKYHQQAIDMALPQVAQRDDYQRLIAGAYNDLGVIASKQTNWSAAIDYFEKSLNICDQMRCLDWLHLYT